MHHIDWAKQTEEQMPSVEGVVRRRFLHGEKMTLARVEFSTGAVTEAHRHDNEQYSLLLSGKMEFVVENQPVLLLPGEAIHLSPGELHGARALEESVVVDMFAPPRTDWVKQ